MSEEKVSFTNTRRLILAAAVVLLIVSGISYYFLRGPSPMVSLQKYSDLELPAGTKGVLWTEYPQAGFEGLYELPKSAIPAFKQRYGMKSDPILTYDSTADRDRCAEHGYREFLRLNEDTGALEVMLNPRDCAKK